MLGFFGFCCLSYCFLIVLGIFSFVNMSQKVNTRSSAELSKLEELLDKKMEHLATKDDLKEIKELFSSLDKRILYQDRKIASLELDNTDFEERISKLEQSVSEMGDLVLRLQDKNAILNNSVDILKAQNDQHEQYSRRSCLRINGIDKVNNESSDDCIAKVVQICNDLNVNITADDIDRAHRVGKERKTMIVKFYSFGKRTSLYKARKSAKNNIKIHLDLTKKRLKLLDEATDCVDVNSNVDFVFADINCNLVARLKSNQYKFFDTLDSFKSKILNTE